MKVTTRASIIAATDSEVATLQASLAVLIGKEHKKERGAVNRKIFALLNESTYVEAVKAGLAEDRAKAAAADEAAHAAKLEKETEKGVSTWGQQPGAEETDSELTLRIYWRNQVEGLFDEYAKTFEHSLVTTLGYDIPEKMRSLLVHDHADSNDGTVSRVLAVDLGCGTGLAGAALRSHCRGQLIGCDLSRKMVAEARKKQGVFDELEACDCIAYLQRRVAPASADLIVAADVLL